MRHDTAHVASLDAAHEREADPKHVENTPTLVV